MAGLLGGGARQGAMLKVRSLSVRGGRMLIVISLSSSSKSSDPSVPSRRCLAGVLWGTGGGSVRDRNGSNPVLFPKPISDSPPNESPSFPQAKKI
jgi:hypothetical protein